MRALHATALLCLALGLAAVARADQARPFDHELHVTNNGRPCWSCHVATGPKAPQVDRQACSECHEKPPSYLAPATPRVGLAFAHAPHVRSLDCLVCHRPDDGIVHSNGGGVGRVLPGKVAYRTDDAQ